jgi:hypothetical protein
VQAPLPASPQLEPAPVPVPRAAEPEVVLELPAASRVSLETVVLMSAGIALTLLGAVVAALMLWTRN